MTPVYVCANLLDRKTEVFRGILNTIASKPFYNYFLVWTATTPVSFHSSRGVWVQLTVRALNPRYRSRKVDQVIFRQVLLRKTETAERVSAELTICAGCKTRRHGS